MSGSTWGHLIQHQNTFEGDLLQLFAKYPNRFEQFSLQVGDILFDYSKQRITNETLQLLVALAEESQLTEHRKALFSGEKINFSEGRAVLHPLLRDLSDTPFFFEGKNIKADIHAVLQQLETFTDNIRQQYHCGITGKPFTDIVCLGIGGSELGPSLVNEALGAYKTTHLKFHFVSNVDGHTLNTTLNILDPCTTLCIISSKTFTTPETMQNAKSIKEWFSTEFKSEQKAIQHCVAVTAQRDKAMAFGILPTHIFDLWDWVGGRYSIWSAVGLPVILAIGVPSFREFLKGAYEMDKHFYSAPFDSNMPVLMALLGIWNNNFWGFSTHAVLPYDDRLARFPAYLQQLEMESNGKSIARDGQSIAHNTAGVIWGGVGCNGQHAYMQLLHQGTHIIPVDFLLAVQGASVYPEQQKLLVASCFSQSKALMEGQICTEEGQPLDNAKVCSGNRPSSTILYPKLTPKILGSLIAAYEHKVFVQGIIWGINSFDQWGVELGKTLAKKILNDLDKKSNEIISDGSTKGLIQFFQQKNLDIM
jgi:glucose-6-phosphate isomerase